VDSEAPALPALVPSPGSVTLVVPPDPAMARVARLTASALAAGVGMTVDAVDDVKIAVSEMLAAFVGRGHHDPVTLVFTSSDGEMQIEASSPGPPFAVDDAELELARLVLEAVTHHHETGHDGTRVWITASLGPQRA
jgi:anti-sigma regulatory factor (Ser/Thr protein kinase)